MDLPHLIDILIISFLVGYLFYRYLIKAKHRQLKKHNKLIGTLRDIVTDSSHPLDAPSAIQQDFSSGPISLEDDIPPSPAPESSAFRPLKTDKNDPFPTD